MPTKEEFLEQLRGGLSHLYDPERLRKSPLAALFGVANRYDTASALRRILSEAVESLRPADDEPPLSRAWRMYYSLVYPYVEQFSQSEAADQLAISARQLRRDQRVALQALADLLWEQYDLAKALQGEAGVEADPGDGSAGQAAVDQELSWLRNAARDCAVDLSKVLPSVLDLAHRLAARHQVGLELFVADAFPKLTVHPVALRQILLNLLSVVIPRSSGGRVHIAARPLRWEGEIRVRCQEYPSGPKPALDDEAASLNMVHELARLCGGRLSLTADARAFDARLALPALDRLPVLAIDDNADTLQLLQHYTAGTRYHLFVTRDPEHALAMAEQVTPQIIVLDVMMPQVDGWEVLSRLRQHPATTDTPIVVCTILAQKDLALFLGASAFVRKPVTRQCFLTALDDLSALMAPGCDS
jgi:CheY-like chemotaxis protein